MAKKIRKYNEFDKKGFLDFQEDFYNFQEKTKSLLEASFDDIESFRKVINTISDFLKLQSKKDELSNKRKENFLRFHTELKYLLITRGIRIDNIYSFKNVSDIVCVSCWNPIFDKKVEYNEEFLNEFIKFDKERDYYRYFQIHFKCMNCKNSNLLYVIRHYLKKQNLL
jgi:hypothetical protein